MKNRSIPFGYCMVNGKYALNVAESEAVKQIFAQYISGKSLKAIAEGMTVPYIADKPAWNKNMVCRVIENRKYLGEGGFPRIISDEDFEQATRIKLSRRTTDVSVKRRDNDTTHKPQTIHTEYGPTDEIIRLTNEINRQLESEHPDKRVVSELIAKCAQLKYSAFDEGME